ncbi:MAG: OmpH family outer membrane protein [Spirochaetales bacterium]|nr:OmpH family outer membrane protein [Spirochaetales bacterium]
MRNPARLAAIGFALFLSAGVAAYGQQQITKVGVVDMNKVVNAFYTKSPAVKELMDYWTETETQLNKISKEITDLEALQAKAKNDQDDRAALEYEKKANERKEYQRDLYRYRKLEYDKKFEAVSKSSAFYGDILNVIERIAVRDSYSLILKTTDPAIMYYSKDVDITQDVIEYLSR